MGMILSYDRFMLIDRIDKNRKDYHSSRDIIHVAFCSLMYVASSSNHLIIHTVLNIF